ncbi:transporter substrate-binding domain-containing protein [Tabrizicola sp.]|uniref:transporter substrate-binding domain-containing protein n=1 Tax=Tabrizicola sp. TaxID=2005166 RepID=UPI002735E7A2|nr:transporter substrate-binding domain-containing protein [Tabrizicola sp.]MDP3197938.1 transporter substrate-binding domain-containing protein [Tabrizicola sp.]
MGFARTFTFGCTAVLLTSATALAQEACSTYTVATGDNLRFIARAAYGDSDLYRVIYEANVATIGAKADLIEIGSTLVIPCDPNDPTAPLASALAEPAVDATPAIVAETAAAPEAVTPEAAVEAAAPAEVTPVAATPAAATAPTSKPISFVTGNGYAPFADEMLPGGGMMTQLTEMAVFRADPNIPYTLTFINDWQAHIDALLPSGAYDLSFPWIRPACEAPQTLSPGDQMRCADFVFSGPFYEIVDGFFALRDSGLGAVTSYADYEGKRICRPEGYTTGVLDATGLTASTVTLVRLPLATDCFKALAAGEVDLVAIDAEVGDAAAARLGLTARIEQNPHLATLLSLHVIAHKSNPRAVAMIGQLDAGLIEMYQSGEWYEIVSTALAQGDGRTE